MLLRHGESTANAAGLLVGRADPELTAAGERQAAALGRALRDRGRPVARLVTSPLRRARATAAALDLDLEAEVDERFVEIDYGEHDGRPLTDVPAEIWTQWRADPGYTPAGGESLADLQARVDGALAELFAHDAEGARRREADVVVVSHVSPIKAAVAWALRTGPDLAWRLHLSTGSLSALAVGPDGRPVLETFNLVPTGA